MGLLGSYYRSVVRKVNIFFEKPYMDSSGRFHTNGCLSAIIEREERYFGNGEVELRSAGGKVLEAFRNLNR